VRSSNLARDVSDGLPNHRDIQATAVTSVKKITTSRSHVRLPVLRLSGQVSRSNCTRRLTDARAGQHKLRLHYTVSLPPTPHLLGILIVIDMMRIWPFLVKIETEMETARHTVVLPVFASRQTSIIYSSGTQS
jgi:hypothetical protein